MDINLFDFTLPEGRIANTPSEPRDSCKLLCLDKNTGEIAHRVFSDITEIFDNNTVLVINDTKVFPARLYGQKTTGGKVEILLLKQAGLNQFVAIGKGQLKPGQKIIFSPELSAEIISKNDEGELNLVFSAIGADLLEKIDKLGKTPLPPYISNHEDEQKLRQQYQTVFAQYRGSAAAPTAGLHFTQQLLDQLSQKGVQIEKLTLHVGLGTFRPVTNEQIESKTLHTENYTLDSETAKRLNEAKKTGKKIIAVGTTSCRTLESLSNQDGLLSSGSGETALFIQPGYKFKFVDGMITNFHLPKTSLLMMVSALVSAPNTNREFSSFSESSIGKAYQEAIKHQYQFFSFGDAMLIS